MFGRFRLQLFAILALLAIASIAPAQQSFASFQQLPSQAPDTPPQSNVPRATPLNPALPTVFIVGDSTARNSADLGWGDHLAPLFDTSRINVANRAIAGRSSRSYIDEGHWAAVLAEMKPGDFLLLQMGHNDSGDLGGPKPRGSLKGIGDNTQDVPQTTGPFAGKTETIHTYGWYLRQMIDQARAKGVHPLLLTLTIRNIWSNGHIERDMGYNGFIRQVAAEEKIPVIDMGDLEATRLEALGQARTALLFPKDHTHTSAEGADFNAHNLADALRSAHSPLAAYLRAPGTD